MGVEESLISEFKSVWLSSGELNIPANNAMSIRPRFKALNALWQISRSQGKSIRLAALETAEKISTSGLANWPMFSPLASDLITVLPSTVNEFYDGIETPPGITNLRHLHLNRPSSNFYIFENVNARLGQTGINISRNSKVDPISMKLVNAERLNQNPSDSIKVAAFCFDRHGSSNICHFLYDVLGRYLTLSVFSDVQKPTLLLLKDSLNNYHKFLLQVFDIPYVEVVNGKVINVEKLYVSSDVANDFSEGYAHPLKLAEPAVFSFIRNKILSVIPKTSSARKIYVSRSDSKIRRVTNDDQVTDILKKRGFSKILMGNLTPVEQFAAFAFADEVIAPHGAGLTSMLVMNSGAQMKEFFHPRKGTDAYSIIANRLKLDYTTRIMSPVKHCRLFESSINISDL